MKRLAYTSQHEHYLPTYQIVVHHAAVGGYWAEVPALPGCVSQGETREELQANIQEAIAGYLEVMREDGRRRRRGADGVLAVQGGPAMRRSALV